MAKTEEKTEREAVYAEIRREIESLPEGRKLTMKELVAMLRRLSPLAPEWTSADIIRELRGPLPEDDPEYQRFLDDRR